MSARKELEAAIQSVLPSTWELIPSGEKVEAPSQSVNNLVQLLRTDVAPGGTLALREHTFALFLMEPHLTGVGAEDNLDDSLQVLLEGIDTIPGVEFSSAERVMWPIGVYPAWQLNIKIQANKKES